MTALSRLKKLATFITPNFFAARQFSEGLQAGFLFSLKTEHNHPRETQYDLSPRDIHFAASAPGKACVFSPCNSSLSGPGFVGSEFRPGQLALGGCKNRRIFLETEGSVNIIRNFSTGTRSKINRGKKRHDADSDSRDVEGLGQRPSSRQALRAIYHAASVQELEAASNLPGIKDCKVLLIAVLQARVTHHSTISS